MRAVMGNKESTLPGLTGLLHVSAFVEKSTPRSKLSNDCLIRVFGTLDFTCELHIPLRCNQPLN